jgi:hypothetical protein
MLRMEGLPLRRFLKSAGNFVVVSNTLEVGMRPEQSIGGNLHRFIVRFAVGGVVGLGLAVVGMSLRPVLAAPPGSMTYRQARDFLAAHTKVVEMANDDGARVAICPEYQGRVMTSTCSGFEGESLGWINRAFIEEKKPDRHFNNYGGEDRFWLAPEGGQYSLWFAPGAEQDLAHWYTPPALNDGPFLFNLDKPEPRYLLKRKMALRNTAKTEFSFDVEREIRILGAMQFGKSFGAEAGNLLKNKKLKLVGFETSNMIINRGAAFDTEKGLVGIWIAGMFPASPTAEVIVPFKQGDEAKLGPAVTADYFGAVPSDRLRIGDQAVYFRADGNFRSKIGTSPSRAVPVAGALDRARGLLTLIQFDMPRDAQNFSYVDSHWQVPQADPYKGDVFNSYNDGPSEANEKSGGFYELESVSPAIRLSPGKATKHTHRTYHVVGDEATLVKLAEAALQIKLSPTAVADQRAAD